MQVRIKKTLFKGKKNDVQDYKDEFASLKADINIKRSKYIGEIVFALNIVLVLIDIVFYKNMRKISYSYVYLYYSHVAAAGIILLWLIVLRYFEVKNKAYNKEAAYHILLNIIIYWCVFVGLNSLNISGQISAYIICVLALAVSVYMDSLECYIIYGCSIVVFITGLALLVHNYQVLSSHIVNSIIVIICGCIASNLNYCSFKNDFINKKMILKSKQELEASNIKLREYEKLRTDFLANISHELRTPLNVIYSAEHMIEINLKEKDPNIEKTEKYLKMIKQNSYRLVRLINNLIDISKIDATVYEIKPINCDIVKIVEDITLSVADYIESKGISLIFDTELEEKIIACDPDKIERIILNLLSNAIKFTEKNGEILVRVYILDSNVCISVKDTGIGISEEMKDLIFDRFIQVDKSISRNREGSGIGLSLVKALVELHKGSVHVNSTIGKGSEFIISLPDVLTENNYKENSFDKLYEQRVEKINIEFSDIYNLKD